MHLQFTEENIQKLFGHEAAEDEDPVRLREYYFKNNVYDRVAANLPLRILVGHKGIGKSALFKISMFEDKSKGNLPILIKPDDIAEMGKNGDDFLQIIRDWKKGLIKIISQKVLNSLGFADDHTFLNKLTRYSGKILNFITQTVDSEIEKINSDPTRKLLIDNFLKNKNVIVYIDDLDRGWVSKTEDIQRISALLNAVRDLISDNPGINVKISLRSDVYYLVRTSDESTDKIEGSVIWYSWTNHEILLLLIKRIETFFGRNVDIDSIKNARQSQIAYYLDSIFEKNFRDVGKWADRHMYKVLMSLIRKRPRDLVKLCTLAAREAYKLNNNNNIIKTEHLKAIFEEYSQGRIQDTVNEYKSELPQIERLILSMKPTKKAIVTSDNYVFDTTQLRQKLSSIIEQGNFKFANGRLASPQDLIQFLYKINFITARKRHEDGGEIDRKYFEENRYLSSKLANFGYDWEIHPAFRWALQPDRIEDIFAKLELSADDK